MERKMNRAQRLYNVAIIVLLGMMLCVQLFTMNEKICRPICILGCCLVLVCFFAKRKLVRKEEEYYFSQMMGMLDDMLEGRECIEISEVEETYVSALYQRLFKIRRIVESQRELGSKDKQEMKGLIADVSHQVRTPLTNIRLLFSTLERKEVPIEEKQQLITAMKPQLDKIEFLLQALIKASYLETGMIDITLQPVNVFDLIAAIIENYIVAAEKRQITFQVDCNQELSVLCDKKWSIEAIGNVIDNGIKYSNPGGCIEITVQENEIYIELSIRDHGIGIRKEHINQIFCRFFRGDVVKDKPGYGVGLYLTREILQMEQGYILAESKEGEGSVFRIYLLKETQESKKIQESKKTC